MLFVSGITLYILQYFDLLISATSKIEDVRKSAHIDLRHYPGGFRLHRRREIRIIVPPPKAFTRKLKLFRRPKLIMIHHLRLLREADCCLAHQSLLDAVPRDLLLSPGALIHLRTIPHL